jgi:hypothetical protein
MAMAPMAKSVVHDFRVGDGPGVALRHKLVQ